ncbi:hypothetical protein P692DRAFT_20821782 [Suillus brevipes Sb2]|nr:hypothetical protein P692DRAFT_20821782 [Suillus brevipes Sb2]
MLNLGLLLCTLISCTFPLHSCATYYKVHGLVPNTSSFAALQIKYLLFHSILTSKIQPSITKLFPTINGPSGSAETLRMMQNIGKTTLPIWLQDFIEHSKNSLRAKYEAERMLGLLQNWPKNSLSMRRSSNNLDWAAEEGEKIYFDGIQDGHHGQEDHLLQYVKIDGTQDSEDPHEDGVCRSFIHEVWPSSLGRHGLNAHGASHAYFEDTQELAILLEEMFRVSFPVFYIKYEAAFLAGHWTVTDPGPLLGRVLVWKLQVCPIRTA